jgi:mannosylglycerate hydrolase
MESALRIPRRLQGESRSPDLVDTAMATTIALARSSPVVSVVTEMDNQAQDHRLRMKISTGLNASTVKSQTLFGAIRRPLRHPEESKATADWAQMPPKTFPFREWVVVDDGRVGLAVACRGMYEYESRQEGESVALYITLLRCIGVMGKYNLPYRKSMTSPGNPTPDAQCPGLCRFEFALIPFRPDADQPAPFLSHARAFLYPPIAHQVIAPELTRRSWQPLFALESGRLQVSAVKRAQDGEGVVLRLWENDGRKDRAVVRLSPAIRQAFLCNLNEEVEQELPIRGNRIQLAAAPYKILTLLLLVTERGKRGGAPKACLL